MKTLKFKIVLWFSLVLILVSAGALVVLYTVSRNILIQDQQTNIQVAVKEFAKKLYYDGGRLSASAGAHFYERGVYRMVFDNDGTLLLGELPVELQGASVELSEGAVRQTVIQNNFCIEYDIPVTVGGGDFWVKGLALLNDEMCTIEATIQSGIILVCILVAAAAVGAYLIVGRALTPVEKIRKTAKEISQSQDLTRRIGVGREKDELCALANTFDEMLDRLEQAFAREKQFSADISHELRTPIAVILSECEYANDCAKTEEEYFQTLKVISRQADRMHKLVSELLTISRMDNQKILTAFELTDISELLGFVCDEQEELQKTGVELRRQIEPEITAMADRELLARLFVNLIVNAYQYSKETGTITVSLKNENRNVVFSVRDTGIGIAQKEIPLIWDRFYRSDHARSVNETNSMGLGLSMVKWIAQHHNGSIHVSSELGEGSEFVFTFPAKQ